MLPSWPLLGVQDGPMSALWLSSGRFGQLGGTKTMVKYSVFVAFSKSTRTADAQPLGARLGVLLCLLLAFWGCLVAGLGHILEPTRSPKTNQKVDPNLDQFWDQQLLQNEPQNGSKTVYWRALVSLKASSEL